MSKEEPLDVANILSNILEEEYSVSNLYICYYTN